jgi:uncharacterized ferritin-like protein (DUF455 family)
MIVCRVTTAHHVKHIGKRMMTSFVTPVGLVLKALISREVEQKLTSVLTASMDMPSQSCEAIHRELHNVLPRIPTTPGLPHLPQLVHPKLMRKPQTTPLNLYLLHAVAHIELNAVHLYCDTALRFSALLPLPVHEQVEFFRDCVLTAADEAKHFGWLQQRLLDLGAPYGSMPAHTGLWNDALITAADVAGRVALVAMVHEAKALDSEERLTNKFLSSGDAPSAAIMRKICKEEVHHVSMGVKWFKRIQIATHGSADPAQEFHRCIRTYRSLLLPPFNVAARAAAGLGPEWYLPVSRPISKLKNT